MLLAARRHRHGRNPPLGARTGGNIEADGASITWPSGIVDGGGRIEARGGVLLRGANVRGGINLSGARLGGDINAVGARIERPGEVALYGDAVVAGGDLALRGATIIGEASLSRRPFRR